MPRSAWPTRCSQQISSDSDLAMFILKTAGVAVVPGIAFGLPGHFRISYAASDSELEEAMNRIATACAQLRWEL
nr:aminotransferase class I/II-fold pyridoxal phosphate-dependent enzyme [Cupriavidus sp. USMAA2-4]